MPFHFINPFILASATHDITIVAVGQINSTTAASNNLTLPAMQEGDVLYLFAFCGTVAGTSSVATLAALEANWTQVAHNPSGLTPDYYVFRYIAPSVPATTADFGNSDPRGEADWSWIYILLRGVDNTTPEDVTPTTATDTGAVGMPDCPSITTVTDKCLILAFGTLDDDQISSGNVTAPTGYTKQQVHFAGFSNASGMLATKVKTPAGAENPSAFVGSGTSNTDDWNAITIAVRPA
jgi:hypothetical protein